MAENFYLPTLSPEGWVQSTAEQADYLFAHFFVSEYSQTHLYKSNVSSFQYIIQNTQGRITDTVSKTISTLTSYFSRYYDNVVADASYLEDPVNSGKVTLNIYVSFTDKTGKDFVLGKATEVVNSKVIKIININNNGK